jgi:hypothetical protein
VLNRTGPLANKKPFMQWLVRGKVMCNILMNWEELKACFTSAELAQSRFDTRFKARLLKEMLSDYKNYLFFEFATTVVQEFERLISIFQQPKVYPQALYQQILYSYIRRVFRIDCMIPKDRKKIFIKLI